MISYRLDDPRLPGIIRREIKLRREAEGKENLSKWHELDRMVSEVDEAERKLSKAILLLRRFEDLVDDYIDSYYVQERMTQSQIYSKDKLINDYLYFLKEEHL